MELCSPDGNIVSHRLSLEQGEVDVNSMTMRHGDEPSAVLRVWVLVWVLWRENGAVWSRHVVATGSCVQISITQP